MLVASFEKTGIIFSHHTMDPEVWNPLVRDKKAEARVGTVMCYPKKSRNYPLDRQLERGVRG